MTTLTSIDLSGLTWPTWVEVRDRMVRHPAVLVALVAAALIAFLATLGALTWLVYSGRNIEVIGGILVVPIVTALIRISQRLTKIEHQTNGTTSRLLDAALPSTTPEVKT